MIIVLMVLLTMMGYALVGGASAARHEAITSARCPKSNHGNAENTYCTHKLVSIWLAGIFWPVGIPMLTGVAVGGSSKEARDERRREKEIAEAKHRKEIERINAEADAELDRRLAALGK